MSGAPHPRPDATLFGGLVDPDLFEDEGRTEARRPAASSSAQADDAGSGGPGGVAKAAGGVAGGGALLVALDSLLKDPAGGGVAQVLAQLGPVLGPVYANAPLLLLLGFGIWAGLREYKRDQRKNARQDRRLQAMFARLAQEQARTTAAVGGVQQEVHGVRQDVQALRADVEGITSEAAELRRAVEGAESRIEAHGAQIRDMAERVDQHDEALRAADLLRPATRRNNRRSTNGSGRQGGRS